MMRRLSLVLFCVLFLCSCGPRNLTEKVAPNLQPSNLRYSFSTKPPDLKGKSKCDVTDVNIVNAETASDDISIIPFGVVGPGWYVNRKEMTGRIVDYLKDAYAQSGVVSNPASKKILNVSTKNIRAPYASFVTSVILELNVVLPEQKTTRYFSVTQTSGDIPWTTVYAIHVISWQIVNDRGIQDYLTCR
jgi:hypothetical protein